MEQITIDYHDLQGVHSAYVEKLKNREPAIRNALGDFAGATSVRWSCIDDGKGNYIFRLVTDRNDCIAQVLPLDLTLEREQFERMLAEGKRSCSSAPGEWLGEAHAPAKVCRNPIVTAKESI